MRVDIQDIEMELVGSFKEEDRDEVIDTLMYYDFYTMYIDNMAQRDEAREINRQKELKLKELGITSFEKIGLIEK